MHKARVAVWVDSFNQRFAAPGTEPDFGPDHQKGGTGTASVLPRWKPETEPKTVAQDLSKLTVHADGRQIAFDALTLREREVWLPENLLSEPRAER